MRAITTLILFTILLNLAVGVVAKLPGINLYDNLGGLSYDDNYDRNLEVDFNQSLNPEGDDLTSSGSSVLDFLGIKAIKRWLSVLDNYMFGFINLMSAVFEGALNQGGTDLGTWIFDGLKGIIIVMYGIFAFQLITGRQVEEE